MYNRSLPLLPMTNHGWICLWHLVSIIHQNIAILCQNWKWIHGLVHHWWGVPFSVQLTIALPLRCCKNDISIQYQDGGLSLPLHADIVKEIKRLVAEEGIERVEEMRPMLNQFVRLSMFRDRPLPPETNRRYFPSSTTIRNFIYRTRLELVWVEAPLFSISNWKFVPLSKIVPTCPSDTI